MYPKMTMGICEPSLGNDGGEDEKDSLVSEEGL